MLVHRCHRNRPLAVEHFRHIEEIAQMIFRRIRLREIIGTSGSHRYSGVPDADNPVRTVPSTGWSPRCRSSGNRAGGDTRISDFQMCTGASRRHRSRTDRAGISVFPIRGFHTGRPFIGIGLHIFKGALSEVDMSPAVGGELPAVVAGDTAATWRTVSLSALIVGVRSLIGRVCPVSEDTLISVKARTALAPR